MDAVKAQITENSRIPSSIQSNVVTIGGKGHNLCPDQLRRHHLVASDKGKTKKYYQFSDYKNKATMNIFTKF